MYMMENRSDLTTGLIKMNHYKTETNRAPVNTTPLFASVWLALFFTLRENYHERRLATTADTDGTRATDSK